MFLGIILLAVTVLPQLGVKAALPNLGVTLPWDCKGTEILGLGIPFTGLPCEIASWTSIILGILTFVLSIKFIDVNLPKEQSHLTLPLAVLLGLIAFYLINRFFIAGIIVFLIFLVIRAILMFTNPEMRGFVPKHR